MKKGLLHSALSLVGLKPEAASSRHKTVTAKRAAGDAAENLAAKHLQACGLKIITRNYFTRAGEVDLIASEGEILIFVEVRMRREGKRSGQFGGALASVTPIKQRRLQLAAQAYLAQYSTPPTCRFDVVLIDAQNNVEWLKNAFDSHDN